MESRWLLIGNEDNNDNSGIKINVKTKQTIWKELASFNDKQMLITTDP